jgi:hypothetical protein
MATRCDAVRRELQALDFKWEKPIEIVRSHQMIDVETVGGADGNLRRREWKCQITARRQPAFIAVMQKVLLGRTGHLSGAPRWAPDIQP